MKRTTAALLALCLLIAAASAHEAGAAERTQRNSRKLSDKRTEKPEEMKRPHRFDRMPTMEFHTGELGRDGIAGWRMGELKIQLTDDCLVEANGQEAGVLAEGHRALVMGPRVGDTIMAWQIRMIDDVYTGGNFRSDVKKAPSDAGPDVGEIISAPY